MACGGGRVPFPTHSPSPYQLPRPPTWCSRSSLARCSRSPRRPTAPQAQPRAHGAPRRAASRSARRHPAPHAAAWEPAPERQQGAPAPRCGARGAGGGAACGGQAPQGLRAPGALLAAGQRGATTRHPHLHRIRCCCQLTLLGGTAPPPHPPGGLAPRRLEPNAGAGGAAAAAGAPAAAAAHAAPMPGSPPSAGPAARRRWPPPLCLRLPPLPLLVQLAHLQPAPPSHVPQGRVARPRRRPAARQSQQPALLAQASPGGRER